MLRIGCEFPFRQLQYRMTIILETEVRLDFFEDANTVVAK